MPRGARPEAAAAAAATLKLGGLTPFTGIDYPGKLAAVLFVQGCPWRCRYCHNPHLQPRRAAADAPAWDGVCRWLARRQGLIDAVVFSGGEPTLDAALPAALREVRALGFATGLHSAGIYPRRLRAVLPLLDWIGFDVKAPLARPDLQDGIVGVPGSSAAVAESLAAVIASGVDFECRTTAHPALLADAELLQIGQDLAQRGVRRWALQPARAVGGLDAAPPGYPAPATVERLGAMFEGFVLRRE